MNTVPQPRPTVKPGRSVRVSDPVNGGRALLITEGKARCGYYLTALACDFGAAYRFEKFSTDAGTDPEADHYDVLLSPDGNHACECKGFLRWGHRHPCKHLACLLTLLEGGRL